ncbi:MAG: metalloprotease [Nanoarchaeota archaeon]
MKFSSTELKHLAIAWIGISIAFGIVIAESPTTEGLLLSMALAAVTVGIGFLFHELSHKFFAQRYRCLAEFRANFPMIIFAVIISFAGFVFAAPGAVMIFGRISKRQHGVIAMAGPLANVVLALLFMLPYLLIPSGMGHLVGLYGFRINAFLALFNLIPFGIFDGATVLKWNKGVFAGLIIIAGAVTFLSYVF